MDPSRAKQRINALYEQIGTLLPCILRRDPLFAASLYQHKVRCGKAQCKCASSDYRHRMWCVSFLEEGKSRTRVVPEGARDDVETMTRDYRRFREARRQLAELFAQLLDAVDALGRARCTRGSRHYERLLARTKMLQERAQKRGKKS